MAKAKIRSVEDITKKFIEVTPGRASYYAAGVENPLRDWEANTVLAASAFKGAVTAADIEKRFLGGVKKAGTAKWKRKATSVGVDRYGPGVMAAEEDYKAGLEPYVAVIAATELPDRKPRGSPDNIKRVQAIANALFKKRLALVGIGASS